MVDLSIVFSMFTRGYHQLCFVNPVTSMPTPLGRGHRDTGVIGPGSLGQRACRAAVVKDGRRGKVVSPLGMVEAMNINVNPGLINPRAV